VDGALQSSDCTNLPHAKLSPFGCRCLVATSSHQPSYLQAFQLGGERDFPLKRKRGQSNLFVDKPNPKYLKTAHTLSFKRRSHCRYCPDPSYDRSLHRIESSLAVPCTTNSLCLQPLYVLYHIHPKIHI